MAVRFDKKWFNPLYFILNDLIKVPTIRKIFIYGGKSSSKTVTVTQVLCKECYLKSANSIAFRKESTTIKTTLKKSFNLALNSTRLSPAFRKLDFEYRTNKGNEIVLKGLDDEEKAKGVESYKYVYLDELNHFSLEEYTQLDMSLRGIEGQKIFASWNPVSETSWVKKELVDTYDWIETEYKLPCEDSFVRISSDGSAILIKTTYEDNYWVAGSPDGSYGFRDENLIAVYDRLKITDFNAYRVNVKGEWGKIKSGSEFWKQFSESKHVKKIDYHPQGTIHVSLDENVNPYVTVSIWQVIGTDLRQINEIPCKEPHNNAPKAAAKLADWLDRIEYKDVLFVYGDPSANKRSTIDENSSSFYDKFFEVLRMRGYRIASRVMKSAPEVALSAAFINDIYEQNLFGYSITISDTCTTSIDDYSVVKEDMNGKMLKEKVKDKKTGVTYEPYGHFSDAKRYFITTILAGEFNRYKSKTRRMHSIAV